MFSKKFLIASLVLLLSIFRLSPGYAEVKNILVGPPIKIKIVDAQYIDNDIMVTLKNVSTEDLNFHITYTTLGLSGVQTGESQHLPTVYYKRDVPDYCTRIILPEIAPQGILIEVKSGQTVTTRLYLNKILSEVTPGPHKLISNLFFDSDKEQICHHFKCEFDKK